MGLERLIGGEFFEEGDDGFVVAGDGGVVSAEEEFFGLLDVFLVDELFLGVGDGCRFEICALDDSESAVVGEEGFEVGIGAVESALEDGSGVGEFESHFSNEVDGGLRIG